MKKLWILTLTILSVSLFFTGCSFKLGENTSAKSDKEEVKTEKVEKKKDDKKSKKIVTKSDEETIAENKETEPDAKLNALSGSERPAGESDSVSNALGKQETAASTNNWLYAYDSRKGYGFYVPDGTTGDWGKVQNVDTFAGYTPNGVGIYVFAWKDKKATRETLMESAAKILEGMGETITTGKMVGESNNYSIAEATSVDQAGVKSKMKVLVGTDVTDNYVMIVGCGEKDYEAKKSTVDAIWGSFEMWSGVN
jgi:hypothetical protein